MMRRIQARVFASAVREAGDNLQLNRELFPGWLPEFLRCQSSRAALPALMKDSPLEIQKLLAADPPSYREHLASAGWSLLRQPEMYVRRGRRSECQENLALFIATQAEGGFRLWCTSRGLQVMTARASRRLFDRHPIFQPL